MSGEEKVEQFDVLENNPTHYLVRDRVTDETKKLYKIDTSLITKRRVKSHQMMATRLSEVDIILLIGTIGEAHESQIDVSVYETWAKRITNLLGEMYDKIGEPNQFHYDIKNIDPDLGGRATTFRERIKWALETCLCVAYEMEQMGKLDKDIVNRYRRDYPELYRRCK